MNQRATGNCPVLQANQWRTESVHVSNWYSNHRTGPPRPPGDRGIVGRRQRSGARRHQPPQPCGRRAGGGLAAASCALGSHMLMGSGSVGVLDLRLGRVCERRGCDARATSQRGCDFICTSTVIGYSAASGINWLCTSVCTPLLGARPDVPHPPEVYPLPQAVCTPRLGAGAP